MKQHPRHGWFSRLLRRLFSAGCHCGCGHCHGACHPDTPCPGSCRQRCDNAEKCGHEMSLAEMHVGQSGRIIEVGDGDQDLINRFADHGLVRGVDIVLHEQALFGGPLLVAVQGTMVALRLNEARMIRVCLRPASNT